MPQAERGLSGICSGTEQLKLENGLEFAILGGNVAREAQAALPHAGVPVPVFAELVLEGGQLAGAHYVEPVWIYLLEIIARVQHGEAGNVQARLLCGSGRITLRPDRD